MQWDEGVQAPNGAEYIVIGRPRGTPLLGRGLGAALLYHDQYEVRVDRWPRGAHRAVWRVVIRGEEAERLVGEIAESIKSGRWMPGDGDPPVDYAPRHSPGGRLGR